MLFDPAEEKRVGDPDWMKKRGRFSKQDQHRARDTSSVSGPLGVNDLAKRSGHFGRHASKQHKSAIRAIGYALTSMDLQSMWVTAAILRSPSHGNRSGTVGESR